MTLKTELEELFDSKLRLCEDLMHGYLYSSEEDFITLGVSHEVVDNYGGEGMGDQFYAVWEFTRGDETVYYRFDGWYASHYGAEYHNYFEVKPKEVTRVEYS